ncbi:MAG: glycosyltransferase family 4 protein [Syntrophales bacterium]|nr:glycosyltransferase family 4 protein [Syntrophales bacterium]
MKRKHKIAVAIPKFGLVGGAEQFAARLTGEMSKRGYEFHIFSHRCEAPDLPITFHRIRRFVFPRFLITPLFAWQVNRKIHRGNFDLVHGHDRLFVADVFTLHGVPHRFWIKEVRKKKFLSLFDRATCWVERRMMNSENSIFTAVSELTKSVFLQEYNIEEKRIYVIHPGVDVNPEARDLKASARQYLNSKYAIGKKERIIFFASMNFEIKGLPEIISALTYVAKKERSFKLIVAGKGDWKRYEIMASQGGISNHLIFTGVLNQTELTQHYLGSDLYLMLSRFDTFGLVVLEAMACGLPVIISSHVGAKDLVEEGKNGFIIKDTSDYEAIAEKITILFQENQLKAMSDNAYETALKYSWQYTAQKYEDVYSRILDSCHPVP